MNRTVLRSMSIVGLTSALAMLGGCAGARGYPGYSSQPVPPVVTTPAPVTPREVVAEVQRVDEATRRIDARSHDGFPLQLSYDGRTRVVFRGNDYAIAALEPGDVVLFRLPGPNGGIAYTDLIQVRESVRERPRTGNAPLQRIEGTVGAIDQTRGTFDLASRDLGPLRVTLPFAANQGAVDRFRRLRSGDFVRLEGQLVNPSRFEVQAFQ